MKKNNKPLIIIVVILLNVLVVYTVGQSLLGKAGSYDKKVEEARSYAKDELCSKSITAYNEALIIKDTADLRLEMIDVYKKGLEIGELTNTYDVITSVTEAVNTYRENTKIYEAACALFIEYGQYENCADILMQARDFHVSSDKLSEYLDKVRYQYSENFAMYTDVLPLFDGHYVVKTEDSSYSFLDDEVSPCMKNTYKYASSFSQGYAFVQAVNADGNTRSFLINADGERQVYFEKVDKSSGVGKAKDKNGKDILLLSCKIGKTYKYFGIDGKEAFGDYKFAGRFRNNVAAVQDKDGTWKLINGAGKTITDKTFKGVVLNEFDECAAKGFIIAKENNKYHIYDCKDVKQIGDFACDDAKSFVDGYAAFKSGDLWGFVDTDGKIVIDAKYENARSFSNSLGAVYGGGAWKLINPKGDIVIEKTFEKVGYLSDSGICFVKSKGYWSYLKFYYKGK